MVQTAASGLRKRGRCTNDESTSESVTKKRKVEGSPPTNGISSNRRSAAARASWEKRKQASVQQVSGRRGDQDSNDGNTATPMGLTAREDGGVVKEREVDPYDLPSDGHEASTPSKRKKGMTAASTPNGIKSRGMRSIPVTEIPDCSESEGNAYDLMQIDDSPSKPPTEKRRGRGRPPGSKNKGTTAVSNKTTRDLESTPTKTHQARRDLGGDIPKPPAILKGILTPSKKRNDDTPRTQKNVAFSNVGEKDDFDIFFDDLPKNKSEPRKVQRKPRPTPVASDSKKQSAGETAEDDEEEDEDVCEICLKPDSNPPNEIIYCDGCDLGFHQKCHNVPDIPDDDWFCKNCSQEDASKTPKRASAVAPAPPTDAPDIPNLDRHLSALQRVLLDRCVGRRRLNLVGLDDAYSKVEQLVEKTIAEGEGNSMLLIGGRGTGKTAVSIARLSPLKRSALTS